MAKRYFINIVPKGGKRVALEVSQEEFDRITKQLIREVNGGPRIIIREKLESGERTHFIAPSQIVSLDESEGDGWPA